MTFSLNHDNFRDVISRLSAFDAAQASEVSREFRQIAKDAANDIYRRISQDPYVQMHRRRGDHEDGWPSLKKIDRIMTSLNAQDEDMNLFEDVRKEDYWERYTLYQKTHKENDIPDITSREKALLCAALSNYWEAIPKLLKSKDDLKVGFKEGKTALHLAAEEGHLEAIQVLIDQGANVDDQDDSGRTALHLASRKYNPNTVELLLRSGASIDALDNCQATALHRAAYQNTTSVVKVLVRRGADLNARDEDHQTPLDVARLLNYPETIDILEEASRHPTKRRRIHLSVAPHL